MNSRAPSESAKPSAVGHTVGRYRVLEQLGAGGMGEVYLALDVKTQRRVALKILPELFTEDERRVRRFQQEARAILALNHPNIVTIYEIGEEAETHFIATELVEGQTLRSRTKAGPLPLKEALDICVQVLKALAAAHEAGIIHRDIKPENIMIRADGYVKVLDFGLAKLVEKSVASESVDTKAATVMRVSTDTGVVMGTVDYMSPEQARARPVDERTDVWSVGVVLYEMVTGRRPFEGETKTDVIAALLEHDPPPLARYLPHAPPELERIVTKALSKDREERYQTVKDLLIDLKNLQRALEIEAELKRCAHSTSASSPTVIMSEAGVGVDSPQAQPQAVTTAHVPQAQPTSALDSLIHGAAGHKKMVALAALALILLACAGLFLAVRYLRRAPANATEAFSRTRVTKLTTSSQATVAAVSPDGKYVAHAQGGRGQQSLWLRHIATGSDTQIIPTAQTDYSALSFSPDGNYIYFLRLEATENVFYRVPVLGGTMQRLGHDIDSMSLSPDGRRVALMRGYPQKDEGVLAIADADGANEQNLVTHSQRDVYPPVVSVWGPAWSPAGDEIVYALRREVSGKRFWNLMAVNVSNRTERQFTNQQWTAIGQIAFLSDGSGLVVAAADEESYPSKQIWFVSYRDGTARRVTNDTNSYSGISITSDATSLVTVQTETKPNVWIAPARDTASAVQATSNNYDGIYGISWTPDGRVLYTTRTGNHLSIWIMNADGSNQKQLTFEGSNSRPVVSPDGRSVVFVSTRTGNACVWRMDLDGGNPRQLTSGPLASRPDITPDGRWVLYADAENGRPGIWKVSIEGGSATRLTDYTAGSPVVSPDGTQLLISFLDEQASPKRWRYGIIPVEGGQPSRVFDFYSPYAQRATWSRDGRSLIYIETRGGVSNLISQPVDGGRPTPLTAFKAEQIFNYGFSRDWKQLAFARGREASDVILINSLK